MRVELEPLVWLSHLFNHLNFMVNEIVEELNRVANRRVNGRGSLIILAGI